MYVGPSPQLPVSSEILPAPKSGTAARFFAERGCEEGFSWISSGLRLAEAFKTEYADHVK